MNYDNRDTIKRTLDLIDSYDSRIQPLEQLHKYIKTEKHPFIFIRWAEWADYPVRMPEFDNLIENLVVRRLEVLYAGKEELKQSLLPL